MVQVLETLAAISADDVNLYYTTDPQLSNLPLLVFHGASTTTNSTLNSSRIQIHVFSAAGFQSYPRLTISPNSPFYAVVNQLPRDRQGDEICRGLAFGLLKYFKDLPEIIKSTLIVQSSQSHCRRPISAPTLFDEQHAANLASTMAKIERIGEIIQDIQRAFQPQKISHVDVDLVLPPGSIRAAIEGEEDDMDDMDGYDPTLRKYGSYAQLVQVFGQLSFLPTSKLRRAPSRLTSLNRSRSFLKEQKLSLRREMGEFVDTEERYVIKMHELVNHIADDFRTHAKGRPFGSYSPSEQDLAKLFPASLDKILHINSAFLNAIRKVMDETEEGAMRDLESDEINFIRARHGGTGRVKDPTGALAFATVLLEWFPRFSACYQDYIRSSQEFPHVITSFLKQQSSFSQRLQQTGEQKLRSIVIEPVQRLPRYSLFIDNLINFLPLTHPALKPLLGARDIITNICSLDSAVSESSQTVNRLRNIVDAWPPSLTPQGRLISAVDIVELGPPFHDANINLMGAGMILLFADTIILLRKPRGSNLSARGLIAEVDKPSTAAMVASVTAATGEQKHVYELNFAGWLRLNEVRFTESADGRVSWMTSMNEIKDADSRREHMSSASSMRAFILQASYEGKASKWLEDVAKARVEGRFSEKERESTKWSFRTMSQNEGGLNMHIAVFEEGIDYLVEGRKEPAPIRIVVDHEKGTKGAPVGHYGVEIVANVTMSNLLAMPTYGLEINGLEDKVFVDTVDSTTFMPVFTKRVVGLLQSQHSSGNPSLATAFISHHLSVLKGLHIQLGVDKMRPYRPPSPVKMLSNFLNSGATPQKHPRTPLLGNIPSMPAPAISKSNSIKGLNSREDAKSFVGYHEETRPTNHLMKLEETFTGYIAALQSRKGNIVGKLLRTRAAADELSVNALYNVFIENPLDSRSSSDITLDVLFSAFEKFLKIAWKNQMGTVITLQTLQTLQEKSVKLFPGDFADFVKQSFGDMTPQNKRAFVAIVKLLADLLDGCGNDGDRGALTVTFAELLIPDGDPHNFINLLDRMVEDSERLFDDIGPASGSGYTTPAHGSVSSTLRSNRSANAGSVSSNTSSLRKRFGLDSLLRQNSKTDLESKSSMWRTLSKTRGTPATGEALSSSLSKASLKRSRSIDTDHRLGTLNKFQPSKDRPTMAGASEEQPLSSNMTSSLGTITASPPLETSKAPRIAKNKRRSSLSDLRALTASVTLDSPFTTPSSHRPQSQIPQPFHSSPRTPSPTKMPVTLASPSMFGSPQRKENVPLTNRSIGNLTERPQNVMSDDSIVSRDAGSPIKASNKNPLLSNIPALKSSLRERTPSSAIPVRQTGVPQKASTQKLRLQSPQKLRERLQTEANGINDAEASLQSELSKIGEEMARLNGGSHMRSNVAEAKKLSESMKSLESRISVMTKDLTSRHDHIKTDLEASLQASEYKVKGLDQLYREASAENEILYEKFNGELAKIVKALRGKGKEEQETLVSKLKESMEETARMKRENAKLKRELLTTRTLLQGHD